MYRFGAEINIEDHKLLTKKNGAINISYAHRLHRVATKLNGPKLAFLLNYLS